MDWLPELVEELSLFVAQNRESVLHLCLAAALGGIIGLEREASGKPAGFRTNLLICLGAALLTDLSAYIARDVMLPGGFRSDPGRVAAQIVSGIGFLGAGTILHARGSVTGLTTAATLWVVAAIGMAVGVGAYVHAIVATMLVMLALMILGRFEDYLIPRRSPHRVVRVVLEPRAALLAATENLLKDAGVQVTTLEVEKEEGSFVASYRTVGEGRDMDAIIARLLDHEGIQKVSVL